MKRKALKVVNADCPEEKNEPNDNQNAHKQQRQKRNDRINTVRQKESIFFNDARRKGEGEGRV